jgi:hypothetical protein
MNLRQFAGVAGATLGMAFNLQAAVTTMPVKYKVPVYGDDGKSYESRTTRVPFQIDIISDQDGAKTESVKNGRPFVAARPGERYAVRIYNPLPVRVAVNLSVDGLNSISGKPSGIADGQKWMIDPYSTITLRGWQVSEAELRRFFFTEKPASYAAWRGEQLNKDLAANCGVIGAAFFWNKAELTAYYETQPVYRYSKKLKAFEADKGDKLFERAATQAGAPTGAPADGRRLRPASEPARDEETKLAKKAGTGMGERESHATTEVAFNYDAGMYKASQAVLVYYDFVQEPVPNPFPALSFAPEMP